MTSRQRDLLRIIGAAEPVTMRQIAEELGVGYQWAYESVMGLGLLVEREPAETELTPFGKRIRRGNAPYLYCLSDKGREALDG